MGSQRTYGVIITSLLRQNDVATSFWRKSDVIITSYVRWDVSSSKFRTTQVNIVLHLQAIAVKKDVLLTATWWVYKHVISGQHWPRSLRWRYYGRDSISITSLTIVYSTVYSDADQRKHQSSAPLAFVWGFHRDRWIPRTKGQLREKCFHLMMSSCFDPSEY